MFTQRFKQLTTLAVTVTVMMSSTSAFAQRGRSGSGSMGRSNYGSGSGSMGRTNYGSPSTSRPNYSSARPVTSGSTSSSGGSSGSRNYGYQGSMMTKSPMSTTQSAPRSSGGNPPAYRMNTSTQSPYQAPSTRAQAPAQKPVQQTSSAELRGRGDAAAQAELARRSNIGAQQRSDNADRKAAQGVEYKYGSKAERDAAKRERGALRDAGFSTSTTQQVRNNKGGYTTVETRSTAGGKTTTNVTKTDYAGRVRTDKTITQRTLQGTHLQTYNKRSTSFSQNGYVKSYTTQRGQTFRNSSRYNTIVTRQRVYSNYYTPVYRSYYSAPLYAHYGFYGGYYYPFHPVLSIYDHFNNPLIYWLYMADYDAQYYRTYWGNDYRDFGRFSSPGVFYPTQELVDLTQIINGMSFGKTANFRMSLSQMVRDINNKAPGVLGANDLVITHQEVISDNLAIVEGYANMSGIFADRKFSFQALLDLNNPYGTIVFVPTTVNPTMSDIADLTRIKQRVDAERSMYQQ